MINMLKLPYTPLACCWVHKRGQAQGLLAMYVPWSRPRLPR
jgi:peptidylprolyl isomerase domain and WD repeat-containing protein 1